jgi:hypothetical protein
LRIDARPDFLAQTTQFGQTPLRMCVWIGLNLPREAKPESITTSEPAKNPALAVYFYLSTKIIDFQAQCTLFMVHFI